MDARKAQCTWMCSLRVPVDEMILKIAQQPAGHPQGRIAAKNPFASFWGFQKGVVVPWNGIETRHGCQARITSRKDQVRKKNQKEKLTKLYTAH